MSIEQVVEKTRRLAEAIANHAGLDFSVESLKEVDSHD